MVKDSNPKNTKYFNKNALKNFFRVNSTILITIAVCGLVLWVFIPQLSNLKESLAALKSANKAILALAILVFCCGFPILALKYYVISPKKILYWLTLQVEIAAAFISKLLPMSIGSLTVNTYYLTKATGNVTIAGSTMALNAATSTVAFIILLGFALIGNTGIIGHISSQDKNIPWTLIVFVILILGFVSWYLIHSKKFINRIKNGMSELWQNFKNYKDTPSKIFGGIFLNGLGSLTGIFTLYLCTHSVGLKVTFSQSILVYTLGNIIGSLVPTPGGLGGTEAGLYGGLVFFGYDADLSLVAVLIYRFITYWLPILPGYIMYHHLRSSVLSDFHIKSNKSQTSIQKA